MFTDLVKTGFKVQGRNKTYTWLPPTLRKYGEFVRWVQYLPYHEAKENNLPKQIQDKIIVECRGGKVKEKVPPNDWPEDKEPKEKDLVEEEFFIHLGSSCVLKHFTSAAGLAKLLQLGISISHPEITEGMMDKEIDNENQNKAIVDLQDAMFSQEKEIEKNEPSPDQ